MQRAEAARAELAVVIVSHDSAAWLAPCLRSIAEHAGDIDVDVVVVENGQTETTRELIETEFPETRLVTCENRGFAHANNVGLGTVAAPLVLFLNSDTEILTGALRDLADALYARPEVALVGVRQVTPEGTLWPTMKRFPNAVRWLFEALGAERFPFRASWLGERELDLARYDRETECDWTSGSFMLVRRAALDELGPRPLDERFFLYSEEPDLCLRLKRRGWQVRHLPSMTILHHAGRERWNPRFASQEAFARRQYVAKHFSLPHRAAALAAVALGLAIRAVVGGRNRAVNKQRRAASRAALRTLLGLRPPPFGEPPAVVPPR